MLRRLLVGALFGLLSLTSVASAQTVTATATLTPTASILPEPAAQSAQCSGSVVTDTAPRIEGTLFAQGPDGVIQQQQFNTPSSSWSGTIAFSMSTPGWYYCSISGTVYWGTSGNGESFSSSDSYEYLGCTNQSGQNGVAAFACLPPATKTMWYDACPAHGYQPFTDLAGFDVGNSCLGRCGSGCYEIGTRIYTQDCADHDKCCRTNGGCQDFNHPLCGDEMREAAEDYFASTLLCQAEAAPAPLPKLQTAALPQDPLTLLEAHERTAKGDLSKDERIELATRGEFTKKEDDKQVSATFALEDLSASVTSALQPDGSFSWTIRLSSGLTVRGNVHPEKRTLWMDGKGGRMGGRERVLLQGFELRLAAEGWSKIGGTVPRSKEYAHRSVNYLSQSPVGHTFDRYETTWDPPTVVR